MKMQSYQITASRYWGPVWDAENFMLAVRKIADGVEICFNGHSNSTQ